MVASSKPSDSRSSEAVSKQEKATLLQEIETLKKQLSAAVPPPNPQECKVELKGLLWCAMCECVCTSVWVCECTCICVSMCECMCVCVCECTCTCICMCVCVHWYTCCAYATVPSAAEVQSIVRTLERTSKSLKAEKAQLQEELTQTRDQLAGKDKELREMKDTLRESQEENTKLTDKWAFFVTPVAAGPTPLMKTMVCRCGVLIEHASPCVHACGGSSYSQYMWGFII